MRALDDKTARLLEEAHVAHVASVYALTLAVSVLALDPPVDEGDNEEEYAKWAADVNEARRLARLYASEMTGLSVVEVINILSAGLADG